MYSNFMLKLVQLSKNQSKLIFSIVFTTLLVFSSIAALAQNTGVIMGKVTDNNTQEALIGVSVILEGTDPLIGATSDIDGKFKITAPVGSYNISASYVGYIKNSKFNIVLNSGNAYMLNFELEEDLFQLDEIKVVADISCDIDGPVASTIRPSTIAEPNYGYNPITEKEVYFKDENAIAVMAVDNLPCELPKDASDGFGEVFLERVIPAFFNNDADGVLARAKMTENGKLTPRFAYLQDFVDGKE